MDTDCSWCAVFSLEGECVEEKTEYLAVVHARRMVNDARVEKDESHAGKIVDRYWYNRNKHIFPASRWEVYDAEKSFVDYSIKG